MVTTRSQKQDDSKTNHPKQISAEDHKRPRSVSADSSPSPKKQKSTTEKQETKPENTQPRNGAPKAKCPENQGLLNALQELVEAVSEAQVADSNLRFQHGNLRKVIATLAKFDDRITSGEKLASGEDKVEGVGKATASYIDDFLQNGHIKAIQHYKDMREKYDKDETQDHDIIHINRAPILTLWATVVIERQGYTHEEALTHAKWISVILARAKGKALGKSEGGGSGDTTKEKHNLKEHVFGHIKVPVESSEHGKRLAVMSDGALNPTEVEDYLRNSLGGNLERVQKAFEEVANSMEPKELKEQAYTLYEKLRPEWEGWAKPGKLDLDEVKHLAHTD